MVFLEAFVREVNLLLLFASLLFSFILLDRFLGGRNLKKISAHRVLPRKIFACEPFMVTFELTNKYRQTVPSVLVEDKVILPRFPVNQTERVPVQVSPPLLKKPRFLFFSYTKQRKQEETDGIFRPVCYFDFVTAGKKERKSYTGCFAQRGVYRFDSFTVSTRFPLGFFRSAQTVAQTDEMIVFPKIGRLGREWFLGDFQRKNELKSSRFLTSRISEETSGLRKWQSGDLQKTIHWRASAKHQELLVRQFEVRQNQNMTIVLDLSHAGSEQNGSDPEKAKIDQENIELAVSFTATLIHDFIIKNKGYLRLVIGGEDVILEGHASRGFLLTLLKKLATVQPMEQKNDSLLPRLLAGNKENSRLILIMPFSAARTASLARDVENSAWQYSFLSLLKIDVASSAFDNIFSVE